MCMILKKMMTAPSKVCPGTKWGEEDTQSLHYAIAIRSSVYTHLQNISQKRRALFF